MDLDAACVIERCVLFGCAASILFSVLCLSYSVFSWVMGRTDESLVLLFLCLLFLAVCGGIRTCSRFVANRLLFALVLILVFLFYGGVTIWLTILAGATGAGVFWLVSLTLCVATFRALRAIGNRGLDIFSAVEKYRRKQARNGQYMKFVLLHGLVRPAGMVYLVAALASVFSIPVAQEFLPKILADESSQIVAFMPIIFLALAWWCYRAGGKRSLAKVMRSEADLPPSFTFYLRSFSDDVTAMAPETQDRASRVINGLFGGQQMDVMLHRSNTLEEVCVSALWPFDSVLCLGRASSQPLGALRLDVPDSDWQQTVIRLCQSASKILLMIGVSSGLAWEYRECLSRNFHPKLILVLPPELPHQTAARWSKGSLAGEQLLGHWRDSTAGTPLADIPT